MAGFSFLAQMLPTALSVANSVNAAKQAKKDYAVRDAEITQATQLQQQQQQLEAEKDTTARRDALRRAVARQKASFGGQGIDSSEGSAEAILLGLSRQSDVEQAQQDSLNQLRNQALENNAATQQRKNLLELNKSYDKMRLTSLYSD